MHEIDESEGADNLPGVKRTRRVSLAPPAKLHLRALWCGDFVRARSHQVIAVVDYVVRTLPKSNL